MTFADWRQAYPGIQPLDTESPGVYIITSRALTGAPLAALRAVDDYRVTSEMLEAHYGPTVWIAPRVDRDDWTRADYMAHRIDHHTYYLSLAQLIGYDYIARIVLQTFGRDAIVAAFASDPNLNNLPLVRWDAMDPSIRAAVSEQNRTKRIMDRSWCGQPLRPGTFCWSLSESVCVVKAVARHLAQGTVSGNGGATVRRYVPTYVRNGVRTLMTAAQGRHTYATPEEAQGWIDAVFAPGPNSSDTLISVWGENPRCEVRPCECWAGHFDPVGIYFDGEDE